ncbi:MAG: ATP-binding protein [bacterium]|nr:ATP-binding protein [bacterium]
MSKKTEAWASDKITPKFTVSAKEKEVEAALKYAESIIATLREPFLVINKNLRVISANESFYATFKITEKETTGRLLTDLGNGEWDMLPLIRVLKEVLSKKMVITDYEVEHEFKTIGRRIISVNARHLRIPKKMTALIAKEEEEEEEEELILLAIEDITVRKELEKKMMITMKEREDVRRKLIVTTDQLTREEKLATIGKLAGIMGHEIRNPLGVIKNAIYFLNLKFKDSMEDEKVKKYMDILQTEISSAEKIISDVLEFARTKPPSLNRVEINGVIQEYLIKANLPKTVKVKTDLGENLPKLHIDRAQIEQVFSNIITNAVEAMPNGGELRVKTSQTDSFVSIAFQDTGVGIPKENISRLFEPLFTTKSKGLGLGLAACRNIITAHQGTIEFGGKEGQGAIFIIKLPIAQEAGTGRKN